MLPIRVAAVSSEVADTVRATLPCSRLWVSRAQRGGYGRSSVPPLPAHLRRGRGPKNSFYL
jgi:hypothetical protein